MKIAVKNLYIYSFGFAILTLLGVISRMISLISFYDKDIGYYQTSAILPDIFHGICVFAIIAALSAFFIIPTRKNGDLTKYNPVSTSARVGSVFALCSVSAFAVYFFTHSFAQNNISITANSGSFGIVKTVAIVLAVPSIIYFGLVLAKKTEKGEGHVLFGYCTIIFILMMLAITYFDLTTAMNSSNKLLLQITLMILMLYMLYELRFSLDNASPSGYVTISLLAVYFSCVTALPSIVAFFLGILTRADYLFFHFVVFGLGVYASLRFITFVMTQRTQK